MNASALMPPAAGDRSEIVTLFEGLEDKEHLLTLTVSDEVSNVWVKG